MKNNTLKSMMLIAFLYVSTISFAHFGSKGPYGSGKITCSTQGGGLVYFGTENGGVYVNTNASLVGWSCKPVGLKSGKIAALDFAGSNLFAATVDSGVFRFTGYVGSDRYWEKVQNGLTSKNTSAIASFDATSLVVGTSNGKIFRTIDNGSNWNEITSLPFAGANITGIVKAGARLILIAENKGVYYSDDNGLTWLGLNDANTLTVSNTTAISYNGTTDEILVKNHNGLFALASASTSTSPVYVAVTSGLILNLAINSITNNGTNWYLATDNGVYTSVTGSINWSTINSGFTSNLNVNFVAAYNTSLIAGVYKDGIYKTANSSISWVANNTGYNNQVTYSVATSGDQVIVAATEKGVFVSKNLATSYSPAFIGLTDYLHVNDLTFKGTKLFAVTENAGVFVSNDTGAVWNEFNIGLSELSVKKVFATSNYLYIFDATGTIYQSNGTGAWTSIQGNLGANLEDVAFSSYGDKVVIAIHGGGVHSRNEASGNWTNITTNLPTDHTTAITTLGTKIYVGTHHDGVFVADISDFNWSATSPTSISHTSLLGLDGDAIQAMGTFGGYVFASYRGGLIATSDHGQTWEAGGNQFNLPSYTAVNKISFVTSRVFVTTENNCLYSNGLSELPVNVAINYPSSPSCINANDGSLSAVATGGTAPYTYLWSNGATTASINNLLQGTYFVTVSDALSISHTDSMTISGASPVTPSINVSADITTICSGQEVTFSQSTTYAGNTPTFEWFINGESVSTSTSIVVDTLVNGDEVYCVLTSSESCISDLNDTSAVVVINVNSALIPSVTIVNNNNNTACDGAEVILVAEGINAGLTPVYEWFVNGNLLSENSDSLTLSTLNDNDIVTCNLISSLTCATIDTVNAQSIEMTINPIPTAPVLYANGTLLSTNVASGNQWYLNGSAIQNATNQSYTVTANGEYSVTVTTNGCTSSSSAIVGFTTLGLNAISTVENGLTIYPNPSNGMFTVKVMDETLTLNSIVIFNEIGKQVKSITDNLTNTTSISTDLSAGIYFVKINSVKGSFVQKLVVE